MKPKNILNECFDKVFCITCSEDLNRQKKCIDQFDRHGIDFEFIISVDPIFLKKVTPQTGNVISPEELSLTISHMICMQKSKLYKFEKIVVFEDDFLFNENWEERFRLFFRELPLDWDLLYLGQPEWTINIYDRVVEKISDNVTICKYGCASHFMAFKNTIFEDCINLMLGMTDSVDIYYHKIMTEKKCYSFTGKSFADALSMPHEKYHKIIPNFDQNRYIYSKLRNSCSHP